MKTSLAARLGIIAAVALVTTYGALLRLDAYTARYGALQRPAWARVMTQHVAPLAAAIKPRAMTWTRVATPYVGGDPINYLKYGREMTTFYQAHVREPLFLAATRAGLIALDGQDAGVSFASMVGSVLAIVATYLLAAAVTTPLGGLAAAAVIALDLDMISWAPDGWRDDLFTATTAFAAWALVRFHQRPAFGNAMLVGVLGGLACLTRITALSFVVPALVWMALARGRLPWRPRLEYAAVAALVMSAVVGPYLLSCAIATGDPFYSINYHTVYYRAAEGMTIDHSMSAGSYLRAKLETHPFATLDTGLTGEFVRPFVTKWTGMDVWSASLATVLRWLALAGLLALPFSRCGRLLSIVLLGSLLPYAFTWNIADGGAWRFTMHAYPLYLAAAMMAAQGAWAGARFLVQRPSGWRRAAAMTAAYAAVVCLAAGAAAFVYDRLPWYVVREAIARRDSVSVGGGGRDDAFFGDGWSDEHTEGLATVRVSREPKAMVYFPLPDRIPCDLVLRLDPASAPARQSLTVLFNSQVVLRTALAADPLRVGAYRVRLPQAWMHAGANQLTLIADPLVTAASAGPRFAWMDPADRIGVRFWYVRVVPLSPGA